MVSGWYKTGDGAESAFVWTEAEGFVDLNQRIDPAAATRARRARMSTESGYIAVTTEAGALALLSPAPTRASPGVVRGHPHLPGRLLGGSILDLAQHAVHVGGGLLARIDTGQRSVRP